MQECELKMEKKRKYRLDEMTWPEAEEAFKRTNIAMITAGAVHPHGKACPLGLDNIIPTYIANRIGERSDVIVLPTFPFGYAPYHDGFPGCLSVSKEDVKSILLDVIRWLHKWGIKKILWNNGHGGNKSVIEEVAYQIKEELGIISAKFEWYHLHRWVDPEHEAALRGPSEGLVDEISACLYVRPELANLSAAGFKELKQPFLPHLEAIGFHHVKYGKGKVEFFWETKDLSDTGGWGPPASRDFSKASAELGKHMVETTIDYIVEFIEAFRKVSLPDFRKASR